MCDRPILIDNPYLGLNKVGLNFLHDTTSLKIPVPCGNCPACISLRQNYFVQRAQMESMDNYLFMFTLTYRQSCIRSINVNGYKLYYADFTDIQKMFKRLRNRGLKFRYHVVSEYGGKNHRPHFHGILSIPKCPKDTYSDILRLEDKLQNMFIGEWKRNYGSDRKPIYKSLCQLVVNHRGSTFDLHYINPSDTDNGEADVAFYVTKYITKSDVWLDKLKSALKLNLTPEKFSEVWKLLKPRCVVSKNWGNPLSDDVKSHIRKGIDFALKSGSEFPFFINPYNGSTFPLSPFYSRRFLTLNDKFSFFYLSSYQDSSDGFKISDERNTTKEIVSDKRFERIRNKINSRLNSYDLIYDDEKINNLCSEQLEKVSSSPDFLPDNWQSDFYDQK